MKARDILDLEEKYYSPQSEVFYTPGENPERHLSWSDDSDVGEMVSFMDPKSNKFMSRKATRFGDPQNLASFFDEDDPQEATEYIDTILQRLFDQELEEQQSGCKTPKNITPKMYSILLDWMVDVGIKFNLTSESYFEAAYIIKYCLGDQDFEDLKTTNLQLLGVSALMIASKNNERYTPEARDYIYIADKSFTKEELLAMEQRILKSIQFHVNFVTPNQFINIFIRFLDIASITKVRTMSFYLEEYIMIDYSTLCSFLPSKIATGCIYLACVSNGQIDFWNSNIANYSQMTEEDAKNVAQDIYDFINAQTGPKGLLAAKRKYAQDTFYNISSVPLIKPT